MIQIEGRHSVTNSQSDVEYRKFTIEEIQEIIKNGGRGMLHTNGKYFINGITYFGSCLSVGEETIPYEKEGKIIVPTYFKRFMLSDGGDGDPEEKVHVEVEVEMNEDVFITLVGA
ncbi:hypothetical protein D3C81_333610 [compost metagenome]